MEQSAVIYARVSSTNDRQYTARQVSDLQKYAESQQIKVEKIFEEHISGAKKLEERFCEIPTSVRAFKTW